LQGCLDATGVDLRPGDVAVIRTGWPLTWEEQGPDAYWSGQPGLDADGGRWLAGRDVSVVAADNAAIGGLNDRQLADEGPDDDLHLILLWRHGVHLAEMLWLEELAAARPADFLFVAAPLRIEGGTASPITPIAVL